jgi:hypothetical protein
VVVVVDRLPLASVSAVTAGQAVAVTILVTRLAVTHQDQTHLLAVQVQARTHISVAVVVVRPQSGRQQTAVAVKVMHYQALTLI